MDIYQYKYKEIAVKKIVLPLMVFLLVLSFIPLKVYADDFSFYGLKFGMTEDEVKKIFKIDNKHGFNKVTNPGHYIDSLFLKFDRFNRLFYIEVGYKLTKIEEVNNALLLAVNEKFVLPLASHKDIETKINVGRDDIFLMLKSKSLSEEYINLIKKEYLDDM